MDKHVLLKLIEALSSCDDRNEPTVNMPQGHPWIVGQWYLIRTVTMIQVGKLAAVGEHELLLESASWIADTGRFSECLKTGKVNEAERFHGECIVGRGAIVDATNWDHGTVKTK